MKIDATKQNFMGGITGKQGYSNNSKMVRAVLVAAALEAIAALLLLRPRAVEATGDSLT